LQLAAIYNYLGPLVLRPHFSVSLPNIQFYQFLKIKRATLFHIALLVFNKNYFATGSHIK
jgi:hypothetical protein